MTLERYDSQRFDELALRLLDVAAMFHQMGAQQQQEDLESIRLNDRKLLEWLGNIEVWAQDARGRLNAEVARIQGAKRARALARKR
jgi:hypothetical protein